MPLPKQSGEELYQSLKMRRRRIAQPLLVLEGKSDPVAWANLIAPSAYLVAAGNRESVIAAHQQFVASGDAAGDAFFIIDCDNLTDSTVLGHTALAVTERRDIESDFMHSLKALSRVLLPVLARDSHDIAEAREKVSLIEDFIKTVTTDLTLVLDAARRLGYRIRLSRRFGQKTRLAIGDIAEARRWAQELSAPTLPQLVRCAGTSLGWEEQCYKAIENEAMANAGKVCRKHLKSSCTTCRERTFANGHDQVALLAGVFTYHLKQEISPREVEDRLRSAAYRSGEWSLDERIAKWEAATGSVIRVGRV